MRATVPLAALSTLLDAIQRDPILWRRLGGQSARAAEWAALVAAEVEAQPEERREALAEARTAPPIGPADLLLSYGQWSKRRAEETRGEGVWGNGGGGGHWPGKASDP